RHADAQMAEVFGPAGVRPGGKTRPSRVKTHYPVSALAPSRQIRQPVSTGRQPFAGMKLPPQLPKAIVMSRQKNRYRRHAYPLVTHRRSANAVDQARVGSSVCWATAYGTGSV